MSEFKPIESQEELNRIIGDRLERQKEKFADYDVLKARVTELEKENGVLKQHAEEFKASDGKYQEEIEGLKKQVAGYETANLRTRIALANGLPYDLADRLVGNDEATLKADAERLAGYLKPSDPIAPLKDVEPNVGKGEDAAYKALLGNIVTE